MRRAALFALAFLIAVLPAAAASGDLDRSFSGDGWVRTYDVFGYSKPYFPKGAEEVAIQPDGKILAVSELQDGQSHWWFGVWRWLPSGDLDRSFGSGGFVANDLGIFPMPHAVALQADGKILVGGQIECPDLQLCFGVVRYNTNGSLDSSFGASGVARATFPGSRCGCELHDLAVQRNGRIVAVGWRFRGGDAQDDMLMAAARFLSNGRLDRTFSGDGRFSRDFGYGDDLGAAVAVQPDGKIALGGVAAHRYRSEDDFVVVRLRQNGRLDRTFSGDGVKTVNFRGHRYDYLYGLDLQRDGHIVAAGMSAVGYRLEDPRIAVLRLNRNGALDRRFGKRLLKPGPQGGYAGRSSVTSRTVRSSDRSAEAESCSTTSARARTGSAHSRRSGTGRSSPGARSTATRRWRATSLAHQVSSRPAALRMRSAFRVVISLGPRPPQSTTSTLLPGEPGFRHQAGPLCQVPSER
jgi:uncharacterized delta-60 repeat protein